MHSKAKYCNVLTFAWELICFHGKCGESCEYSHLIQHRNIFSTKWPEKVWMNTKSKLRMFHIRNPWTWTCFKVDFLTNAQGEGSKSLKKTKSFDYKCIAFDVRFWMVCCKFDQCRLNIPMNKWAAVSEFCTSIEFHNIFLDWAFCCRLSVYCIRNSKASYGNPLLWLHNCVTTHKAPNEINIKGTNKRTTKLSHFQPLNGMDGWLFCWFYCVLLKVL